MIRKSSVLQALTSATVSVETSRSRKTQKKETQKDRWYKKQLRLGVLTQQEAGTLLPSQQREERNDARPPTQQVEKGEEETTTRRVVAAIWSEALKMPPRELNARFSEVLGGFPTSTSSSSSSSFPSAPPQWHAAVALLVHLDKHRVRPSKQTIAAALAALMSPDARQVSVDMLVQMQRDDEASVSGSTTRVEEDEKEKKKEEGGPPAAAATTCLFVNMRNAQPSPAENAPLSDTKQQSEATFRRADANTNTDGGERRSDGGGILAARWDVAAFVVSKLPQHPMLGASTAMSSAVRSTARAQQWEASLHIFEAMCRRGVSVNPYSVSSLVALLDDRKMHDLANSVTCRALEMPDTADLRQLNSDSRSDDKMRRRDGGKVVDRTDGTNDASTTSSRAAVLRIFRESVAENDWFRALRAFQRLLPMTTAKDANNNKSSGNDNVTATNTPLLVASNVGTKFAHLLAERGLYRPLLQLWQTNQQQQQSITTQGAIERALVRTCNSIAKRSSSNANKKKNNSFASSSFPKGWAICIGVYNQVVATLERHNNKEAQPKEHSVAASSSPVPTRFKTQLATIALKACRVEGRWEEAMCFFQTLNQQGELITFPMMSEAIGSCSKSGFTLVRAQLWLHWLLSPSETETESESQDKKKNNAVVAEKSLMLLYTLKDPSESQRTMQQDDVQSALVSSPTVASAAFALLLARSRSRSDAAVWAAALQTLSTIVRHQRASYLTGEMMTAVVDMCVRHGQWRRAFDVARMQALLDIKPTRQGLHMLLGALEERVSFTSKATRNNGNFWTTALSLLESAAAAGCLDRPVIDRVVKILCVESNQQSGDEEEEEGEKTPNKENGSKRALWADAISLVTRYRNFSDYSLSHILRCRQVPLVTSANATFLLRSTFPVAPGHVLGRRVIEMVHDLLADATLMNQWQVCCAMLTRHVRAVPTQGRSESTTRTIVEEADDPYRLYAHAKLKCSVFYLLYKENNAIAAIAAFEELRQKQEQDALPIPVLLAALDALLSKDVEETHHHHAAEAIAQYLDLVFAANDEASTGHPSLDDTVRATTRHWEKALELLTKVRVV